MSASSGGAVKSHVRTPVLHIGWWRNGYHAYEQPVAPIGATPVPAPDRSAGPSDDLRQTGALYAVAIAGVCSLITFGLAMPGIPIAGLLGWKFGGSFATRGDRTISMTVLAVLGTDLMVAALMGLTLGPAMAIDRGLAAEPIAAIAQVLGGLISATATMALLGLLFFGLPGLLIAAISASVWHHFMRRRFSQPDPEGGDRGSADQHR